ncbi:MAG: hypothetical protein MZV63_08330 [Marinilabiliales bacterium]|nr:hypothetical protein [Marinilabiliales bacterium]
MLKRPLKEPTRGKPGNYQIIHMAMHTLVNDQHPAFSKMIFSASRKAMKTAC